MTEETVVITSLEPQRKRLDRISVYVDGEFGFGVRHDVALEFGLSKGMALSETAITEIKQADDVRRGLEKALSLLSRRLYSRGEIRSRLRSKGYDGVVIERIEARLSELGYLDDRRFASEFARQRFASNRFGPQRIIRDLRQRGIPEAVAREAVRQAGTTEDLLDRAGRLAQAYLRKLNESDRLKRRKKLGDHLLRRGFGMEAVLQTVRKYIDDA